MGISSCVNEAQEIDYSVNYSHVTDFAALINALDSQTATIAEAAEKINSDNEALIVLTASCSTPGSESYNKELSDRCASAVREALIAKGVSAERITDIISLGKEGMTSSADCRRVIIDVK